MLYLRLILCPELAEEATVLSLRRAVVLAEPWAVGSLLQLLQMHEASPALRELDGDSFCQHLQLQLAGQPAQDRSGKRRKRRHLEVQALQARLWEQGQHLRNEEMLT